MKKMMRRTKMKKKAAAKKTSKKAHENDKKEKGTAQKPRKLTPRILVPAEMKVLGFTAQGRKALARLKKDRPKLVPYVIRQVGQKVMNQSTGECSVTLGALFRKGEYLGEHQTRTVTVSRVTFDRLQFGDRVLEVDDSYYLLMKI